VSKVKRKILLGEYWEALETVREWERATQRIPEEKREDVFQIVFYRDNTVKVDLLR